MDFIWGLVFIFFARVTDVSLSTTRMILVVRGKKLAAASIGFFETIVYVLALKTVFATLDNPINLIVYGLAYSVGNVVGIFIEEKMAMGYLSVQVITMNNPLLLANDLREKGYGVTVINGQGKDGIRYILQIIMLRKKQPELRNILDEWDPNAFVIVLDARKTRGGVVARATR